jgi:hypothetical protein
MNSILDFLNQPIVLTLVTLTVGSYLLNLVTERRARKDKLREKTIDFLSEAGNNINQFLTHVYRQLRTNNIELDQAIADGLKELHSKRIGIQVGSQAYLNSKDFPKQYYQLLDELGGVVLCIDVAEKIYAILGNKYDQGEYVSLSEANR